MAVPWKYIIGVIVVILFVGALIYILNMEEDIKETDSPDVHTTSMDTLPPLAPGHLPPTRLENRGRCPDYQLETSIAGRGAFKRSFYINVPPALRLTLNKGEGFLVESMKSKPNVDYDTWLAVPSADISGHILSYRDGTLYADGEEVDDLSYEDTQGNKWKVRVRPVD